MNKKYWVIIISAILLSVFLVSCTINNQKGSKENIETRLPMGYIPDIQQAPVYVADKEGLLDKTGYSFTFDYSYETDGMALVAAGEVPFAFGSGEQVLLAREQGLDVVYVMTWYQKYPVSIVALADSQIKTPQDLIGKSVGIPGAYGANYIALKAFLSEQDLSETDIILESIGYNQAEALVTKTVDAASVYRNNTPVQLRSEGYQIIEFPVSDYINLASNGLITSQKMIAENPEIVQLMVSALIEGIEKTIDDPEQAYSISKEYIETLQSLQPDQEDVQKQVLAASINLWNADNIGEIEMSSWQNMADVLFDMDLLTKPADLTTAITTQFIK